MPRLALSLLGPFQVTLDDQPLTTFELDRARALLAYLAVEADRPRRRETLAGWLWPDILDASARQNLRQTLFSLRQTLRDQTAHPPFFLVARDTLQFNLDSDHTLDVAQFNALLAACETHAHADLEACEACSERLTQVVNLYRGPFLQEFPNIDSESFEEWIVLTREDFQRRTLEALLHLSNFQARREQHDLALRYSQRQLELDQWREEAHRQTMRALWSSNRRSEALAQYEACRRVLADELGIEPSAETQALYRQIKTDSRSTPIGRAPTRSAILPAQLTPFVGRERELTTLAQILSEPTARLITLLGAGGMGKTRLALQVAAQQQSEFAHGVCFVPLAPVASIDQIVPAIANTLNLTLSGSIDPQTQLLNHLHDRQMLLVLDNFEHLMAGVPLIMDLLRAASHVKVLITSRETLAVQSEWVYDVGGLGTDARTLFWQSARRARPGATFEDDDLSIADRVCQLVGGMPLAIELAAAWLRVLSCTEIEREIQRGLDILASTLHDVPERHRSIRAVFDQAWRMLSDEEQRGLCRLTAFRGGFGREAADRVAGTSLWVLSNLVARALIERTDSGRYDLHELVRQYAVAKLPAEVSAAQRAHADYYLSWIDAAAAQLYGPDQAACTKRLEQEQDNWRAAFEWSLSAGAEEGGRYIELTLRQATALARFWIGHYPREGCQWLEQALAVEATLAARAPAVTRAGALNIAGWLARTMNDFERAKTLLAESLALGRAAQNTAGIANVLDSLGDVAWSEGDYQPASAFYEESLALRRALGVKSKVALSLSSLANAVMEQGDTARAATLFEESLLVCRELSDKRGTAMALYGLGLAQYLQGDNLHSKDFLKESLSLFSDLNNRLDIAMCVEGLALVAVADGRAERALRLWGASEVMFEALGASLQANYGVRHERGLAIVQAQFSEAVSGGAAFAGGRAMPQAQAVTYALTDDLPT